MPVLQANNGSVCEGGRTVCCEANGVVVVGMAVVNGAVTLSTSSPETHIQFDPVSITSIRFCFSEPNLNSVSKYMFISKAVRGYV